MESQHTAVVSTSNQEDTDKKVRGHDSPSHGVATRDDLVMLRKFDPAVHLDSRVIGSIGVVARSGGGKSFVCKALAWAFRHQVETSFVVHASQFEHAPRFVPRAHTCDGWDESWFLQLLRYCAARSTSSSDTTPATVGCGALDTGGGSTSSRDVRLPLVLMDDTFYLLRHDGRSIFRNALPSVLRALEAPRASGILSCWTANSILDVPVAARGTVDWLIVESMPSDAEEIRNHFARHVSRETFGAVLAQLHAKRSPDCRTFLAIHVKALHPQRLETSLFPWILAKADVPRTFVCGAPAYVDAKVPPWAAKPCAAAQCEAAAAADAPAAVPPPSHVPPQPYCDVP
jgi:hypothetical protein